MKNFIYNTMPSSLNNTKSISVKNIKYVVLAIYGVLGAIGWYSYFYNQATQKPVYDHFSPSHTLAFVKSVVWYHSRGKLQELRSILLTDDLSNEERIKTRIENMLKHRTSAYIRQFNELDTPVNNLGDWYASHFDFENFLKNVFIVVFEESTPVDTKVRDIADIMEQYQNETSQKLIDQLKTEDNDL